jgi:hypothetical protein
MQWVTPIATAGFAFGIPAKQYWRDVRNPRFLWTLIALLVAHFAFFFFVLSPSWRRNPLLICVVGLPEMYVAYTALIFLLKRLPAVPNNIAKGGN